MSALAYTSGTFTQKAAFEIRAGEHIVNYGVVMDMYQGMGRTTFRFKEIEGMPNAVKSFASSKMLFVANFQ